MATKSSTLSGVTSVKGMSRSLGSLTPFDRQIAAPDAAAALAFRILEDGRGKVAALDRGERFRQAVDAGHRDLQVELLHGLQRAEDHVVIVGDDEVVVLVLGEDALGDRLALAAVVVGILLDELDLVAEAGRVEIVLHAVVAGDIGDLAGDAAQIDALELVLAELLVEAFEELAELHAGIGLRRADEGDVVAAAGLAVELDDGNALLVGGIDGSDRGVEAGRLEGEAIDALGEHGSRRWRAPCWCR